MSFTECNGTHAAAAVCWLCSDARPWWREARIKAGYPTDPPNTHPNHIIGGRHDAAVHMWSERPGSATMKTGRRREQLQNLHELRGQVRVEVALRVDMSELQSWSAPQLNALMAGIGQVLAVTSKAESGSAAMRV